MANWSEVRTKQAQCTRGEDVIIHERDDQLIAGGKVKNRVCYRTLFCSMAPEEGIEFVVGRPDPRRCDDCDLIYE